MTSVIGLSESAALESAEVANLVTWLSSSQASFVTGAYYAVDCGYLAQ